MANRYSYEFKTFKSGKRKGQEYVNKRSVKTGKTITTVSSKAKVKSAHRSAKQQVYRAGEKEIDDMIRKETEKYGGNYASNKKRYKAGLSNKLKDEAKRVKKGKKEGKAMRGRAVINIKKDVVRDEVEKKSGYVTVWRMYWLVSEGRFNSPYIAAREGEYINGDAFSDVVEHVKDESFPIIAEHESTSDYRIDFSKGSGACVRLILRETGETLKAYGLGSGCKRVQGRGLDI